MSEYDINQLYKRFSSLDVSPQFDGYSGVEIIISDDTAVFSGSRNGRVITITNPWGTQEQADNILASIAGFQYQPYVATDALLNPAAELGDGVMLNGLYSGIYKISRNYTPIMNTDIEAPQDEEIDHEYPWESKENRDIDRRFMAVEAEFAIQSDEISAKVSQTGGESSSFGWDLLSDHFSLYSGNNEVFRVDSTGATVKGIITATGGKIGNFNIGSQAIWHTISAFNNPDGYSSGVYLGTDGIRLGQNFTVNSQGNVSANNMTISGTLNVGGALISAASLRQGASYGSSYGSATYYGTTSYPTYFTCGSIFVKTSAVLTSVGIAGSLTFKAYEAKWQTLNIGGTYYTVLVGT